MVLHLKMIKGRNSTRSNRYSLQMIVNELDCVYYAIVDPLGISSVHRCLCTQRYAFAPVYSFQKQDQCMNMKYGWNVHISHPYYYS